jgi:ribosomal protein S18 acetylase RimI-like enzyme
MVRPGRAEIHGADPACGLKSPSMVDQPGGGAAVWRAEAADADVIGRLLYDFNREYDEPTPPPQKLAERLRELIASGETMVLLARSGPIRPGAAKELGRPEGLAVLRFRPSIWSANLECYLAELYVVPDRRGQGLGRQLMETVLDQARRQGADHVDLGTSQDDVAARALYESLGFVNREKPPDGPITYFYEIDL